PHVFPTRRSSDVGQIEVEQDDVVIIQLAQIEAFLAQIGRVDVEALAGQHQLDGLGRGRLVLDQQHAHCPPSCRGQPPQVARPATYMNLYRSERKRLIWY